MAGIRQETEPTTLSAQAITQFLDATLIGDGDRTICSVNVIERACADQLAFIGAAKELSRIKESAAQVIIVPAEVGEQLDDYSDRSLIVTDQPEAAYLRVALQLVPVRERRQTGISPHAVVSETATVGERTNIHPHAVVGEDVEIGTDCDIGPGVVIGDGCRVGDRVILDANVVLYPDLLVGHDVHIQAGSVIGADGFGYRTVDGRHERLPHVGTVEISDDVQIGACVTIDRAKSGETSIGRGTRIDNLVMVGHNCQIGEHNILVSQTGIAGSCSTGSYVVFAGQSGIADHVHIGDGAMIGAQAGVHRDMPGGKAYLGAPAEEAGTAARILSATRRLPEMRSTIRKLEKQMADLQEQLAQLHSSSCLEDAA